MTRNLTEKQQKFLDVYFEEAKGNPVEAKKLAGYSKSVTSTSVMAALQEEVKDLTYKFLAAGATRAAYSLVEVMTSPTALGNKEKLTASKDLLDRGGHGKVDRVDVNSSGGGVFILPAKEGKNE